MVGTQSSTKAKRVMMVVSDLITMKILGSGRQDLISLMKRRRRKSGSNKMEVAKFPMMSAKDLAAEPSMVMATSSL